MNATYSRVCLGHDSCDDSTAADAGTRSNQYPHDNEVVQVQEISRFPLVWGSLWDSSISSSDNIVSRADVSCMTISPDETHDEPDKGNTSEWTSNTGSEFTNALRLESSGKELEDSNNKGDNVDDESPEEP